MKVDTINYAKNGLKSVLPYKKQSYSKNINFTSDYVSEACKIKEKLFDKKDMICDFKDNAFVGKCTEKAADLFEELFGKRLLPTFVYYSSIPNTKEGGTVYGSCSYNGMTVRINSDLGCFNSKEELAKEIEEIADNLNDARIEIQIKR